LQLVSGSYLEAHPDEAAATDVKAEGEEREQLKWFAYIASVIGVGMFFAFLSTLVDTAATRTAGDIGWVVGALALGVGLPAAVGIAILRYRLYDIDWIISHTLVYVPLTALLAGVYIALTGVARALLSDNTGANSDAAVAFTTIVVVAMLTPAKNYLQEIVDRHFKEDRDPASRLDRLGKEARAVAEMVEPSLFVQRYLESTVDTLDSLGGSIKLNGQWKREFTYREIKIAALSLAISRDGQEIGVLQVSRRRSGRPYSPTEIEALRRSVDSVAYLVGLEDALRRGSVRSRV
jgi:hypothetical protein